MSNQANVNKRKAVCTIIAINYVILCFFNLAKTICKGIKGLYHQSKKNFCNFQGKIDEAENTIRKVKPEQDIPSKIKEILDGLDKFKENSLKSGSKIHLIKKIHQHPEIYKPFLIVTFLRFAFIDYCI